MAVNRNQAIDKAIQPMLDMLEQTKTARQAQTVARAEQEKVQLLEALLPTQVKAAGRDYKEARAAEAQKAREGAQGSQQKQAQQMVPSAVPINTADPTAGLGSDSASRLKQMVMGGAAVQSGGADRTGASGIQGQGAPGPGGAAQGGGVPGAVTTTPMGSPESFGMQLLRASLNMPQVGGGAQQQTNPTVENLADRGSILAQSVLVDDPKADPRQDKEFASWTKTMMEKYPDYAPQIINEAIGKAQFGAQGELRRRGVEDANYAQTLRADGAPEASIKKILRGRNTNNDALMFEGYAEYEGIAYASAQLDLENAKLTNRLNQIKVDQIAALNTRQTLYSWANGAGGRHSGPGRSDPLNNMLGIGNGAGSGKDPVALRKQALETYRDTGWIGTDISTQGIPSLLTNFISAFSTEWDQNGIFTQYNFEDIFSEDSEAYTNPAIRVFDIGQVSEDLLIQQLAVSRGGLTLEQFNNTPKGKEIARRLELASIVVEEPIPGQLNIYADRNSPFVRGKDDKIGEGIGPSMDTMLLAIENMNNKTVETGVDRRLYSESMSAMPIKGLGAMFTPGWAREYAGTALEKKRELGEYEAAGKPEGWTPQPHGPWAAEGEAPTAPTSQPVPETLEDARVAPELPASGGPLTVMPPVRTPKPSERPNVIGKSPAAAAAAEKFLKAISKGAVPPNADEKIKRLFGVR